MMGLATLEAPIDGAHQTVLNTAFHLNATPFAMLSQEARSRFLVQRTSVHLETNVGRWKQMQEKLHETNFSRKIDAYRIWRSPGTRASRRSVGAAI
jgi:hypothetical protein